MKSPFFRLVFPRMLPSVVKPFFVFSGIWNDRRVRLAALGFGGAVCVGGAVGAAAFCRPLDTPYYLIPYYLRDVRSRFLHYASTQKRKGGPKYMNADDFVLALLGSPDTKLKNEYAAEGLTEVFRGMDVNGDGFLSFSEFRFLMALLTSKPGEFEMLFRIVDDDHNGSISIEQFADVLRGVTQDENVARTLFLHYSKHSGILKSLFGTEESPKQCTFEQLNSLIRKIREEVWKAEFRQYDEDRKDEITIEKFSDLIGSQMLGSHLPYFLLNNIKKLQGNNSKISLDMWIQFHEILLKEQEVAEALELYSASGLPITRKVFQRAIEASGIPPLPSKTVNVVFAVFDKDGDGNLEIEEFFSIMRQKMSFHYQKPSRERVNLPTRFVQCSKEAWEEL